MMPGRSPMLALVGAAAVLKLLAGSAAAQWPALTVESGVSDFSYGRPSAVFDQDDHLLIGYYHFADRDLGLADLTPCGSVSIRPRTSSGNIGRSACVLVNSENARHAVFWGTGDDLAEGVRYRVLGNGLYGDATVTIPAIPMIPGAAPPAVVKALLDARDRPYVLARHTRSLTLAHFNIAVGQWESIPLGTPELPFASSSRVGADLAINRQGELVIACVTSDNRIVVGTLISGGFVWRSHAVPTLATDCDIALACDPVGAPLVMCKQHDGLHLLRFHDLGVADQLIEPTVAAGFGAHSLAVDQEGRVFLAWRDLATGAVKLTENSFGWHTTSVDSEASMNPGSYPAVALNRQGLWAVAYVDAKSDALKVAGPGARLRAPGDFDCDGHVDQLDGDHLRNCWTGAHLGPPQAGCTDTDLDVDTDVDLDDHALFQRCLSGPINLADPDCLRP